MISTTETASDPKESPFQHVGENLYRHVAGTYYGLIKRGGKQFRRSLKTTDRTLAQRRLADLRNQVAALTLSDEKNASFADVANAWLASVKHALKASSVRRRQVCIDGLLPFFEEVTIRNISDKQCTAWVEKRGNGLASETFVKELDTLRLILDFALNKGLILSNPARLIKRRKIVHAPIQVPSREQFASLIATIRKGQAHDAADLLELLAYSGARLNEATSLRWTDVNLDAGTVLITGGERGTKNHETRLIPMTDALRTLLLRLKGERTTRPEDRVSRIGKALKTLSRASEQLGFPCFTQHELRHFFATTCIESGVDIPTISRWLGHKDGGALAMRVYGHLRQEHSFSMIKRVVFHSQTIWYLGSI